MVTWHWFVRLHVSDLYDERVQTKALAVNDQLCHQYHVVGGLSHWRQIIGHSQ